MDLISVIIPVYNAEEYIFKCVDSILKQSYKKIELILINDGSTDNSLKILKMIKKDNPNVKINIIDQENSGVAKTRNKGIDLAKGKYIMFIDNDDWVLEDYIKEYYNRAKKTKADIVVGGYRRINSKGKTVQMQTMKKDSDIFNCITPWAKIYRTSFLRDNKIEYLSHGIGEDIYFNLIAYSKASKISIIDNTDYVWYYNELSVSNTSQKSISDKTNILYLYKKIVKKVKYSEELEYFFLKNILWYLLYTRKGTDKELYKKSKKEIICWYKDNFKNYKKNKILVRNLLDISFDRKYVIPVMTYFYSKVV